MNEQVIHSTDWTGSAEEQLLPNRAVPHYSNGSQPITPYHQVIERRESIATLAPGAAGVMRWLFFALLAGPLSLWLSLQFTKMAIRDYSIWLNSDWLVQVALLSGALSAMQLALPVSRFVTFRKVAAIAVLVATFGFAFWFAKTALEAHRSARQSSVERVFVHASYRGSGRMRRLVYSFQRADGTMVDGSSPEAAPASGVTCADVQRIEGKYGFRWIRMLGTSQPPAHEILWPIRAEDCFSNKPLSALRG